MIELLQLPGSVFDRRLQRDGIVAKAKEGHCTLFVRSVFLQGLALMSPEATPSGIPRAKEAVGTLKEFCRSHDVDRKAFCLHYALNRFAPGILVIGVERGAQISEIARLTAEPALPERLFDEWDKAWPNDIEGLINPSGWPEVRS
jgi:aryl-alcohol dehydrogenase-like predicted oxidoreductase